MNRRGFLSTLTALAVVPFVRLTHDDQAFVQAYLDAGRPVPPGVYHLSGPLAVHNRRVLIDRSTISYPADRFVLPFGTESPAPGSEITRCMFRPVGGGITKAACGRFAQLHAIPSRRVTIPLASG